MKKITLLILLLVSMMNVLIAATVTTNKTTYTTNEHVRVHFANMTAKNQDWIGIYPQGSSNDWNNVIGWKWTDDKTAGDLTFGNGTLPIGAYEVRAFYNNSFHTEATTSFRVGKVVKATVTTNKTTYTTNEHVRVHFANMRGKNKDWIGIYPQGSSNAWDNVIGWKWTDDRTSGDLTFGNGTLPVGAYEARAFYNNSFHTEASINFRVHNVGGDATTVTTNKETYTSNENIVATYKGTTNGQEDWIAIYPKNSTNAWGNVIEWRWIRAKVNGNTVFPKLPVGEYEVRVFFNNTFQDEAKKAFSVKQEQREVYLIQGQSNAFAGIGGNVVLNEKVKSFGTTSTNANRVQTDLNWYAAQGNLHKESGFIGKWGMKMSSDIANSLDIPLVVLNGAVSATPIDQHLRDNANPENLNTIYGRLLYRANKANIANDARVLFWYQGENDGTEHTSMALYKERFRRLYNSWKTDYKNLEKIYMFQVRSGCGNPALIMEAQREIANEYDDVIMMSTTGTDTETLADNCHYTLKGYNELAIRMERLVKDDLYHIAQDEAHPPEVASLKFTNNRKSVILKLKEAQNLQMVGNPKKDFIVENSNVKVTSISILNTREIRLNFSNALANNAKLTYFGHRGSENSWIQNSNKVGLITFYSMSINN